MSQAKLESISPFFIVTDVEQSSAFYQKLGFEVTYRQPELRPFTAILVRDHAQLFIKSERGIGPQPNATRHRHLRWDAYLYTKDPDALAEEFRMRDIHFCSPLQDTSDGLRGFELKDPDGYILFFGRPR